MRTRVYRIHIAKYSFAIGIALLLQGCAMQQWQVTSIAEQLRGGSPELALGAMEALTPPARDQAQYLLNLAMLKHLTGNIDGSIGDLAAAIKIMDNLQAVSVSESVGASTINETLRAYVGSPSERVLARQLQALNYLAKGDLDGARVEVLQGDVLMRKLADGDSINGQLASARYLEGVIYELGGETSNALISYRKAANLMDERGQTIPLALQQSLVELTKAVGISEEYQHYVERFGFKATPLQADEAEAIAIYWQGIVSQKKQKKVSLFAPGLNHFVSIALPSYPSNYSDKNNHNNTSLVSLGQYQATTELVDSVNELVRDDLNADMPAITATTMVRVVAKHQAVKEVRNSGSDNNDSAALFFSILTDIAANVSEVADIRSWNTLPANIQVARLRLPAGEYPVTLGRNQLAANNTADRSTMTLKPNSKALIFGHGVGDQLYVYNSF